MTFSIIAKKECDLRLAIAEILHPDPDRLIFHKLCMDWDGNWRIYTYLCQGIFLCGGNYCIYTYICLEIFCVVEIGAYIYLRENIFLLHNCGL